MTALIHLSRPFAGTYQVTQPFGPTTFAAEPPGYLWPDGTLSYYQTAPGATRLDHGHSGIDYAVSNGTPLLAPADGTVTMASLDSTGYGLCLRIDHGPVTSLMGHLTSIFVPLGAKVKAGQVVAHSGGDPANEPNSGNSNGAHLHLSTIDTTLTPARYRNPADYILAPVPAPKPTPKPANIYTSISFSVTAQSDNDPVRGFVGPSTACPVQTVIPAQTVMQAVGWMLGEPRTDRTTGKPDSRWYLCTMPDSGQLVWCPSARLLGNAPGSKP